MTPSEHWEGRKRTVGAAMKPMLRTGRSSVLVLTLLISAKQC
jgi:hypothetical protein